jgi:hypothetical protein
MNESPQEILDSLVSDYEQTLEGLLKRPGMFAGHLETFDRDIGSALHLIERIKCGKESNHTIKALKVIQKEYFGDGRSPLVNHCRFVYLYEVDSGNFPEDNIPVSVRENYRTMPQNRDHLRHAEIIDFYRKWVKLALSMMSGDS